jgi:membrane-associated phospholipid phosphatase
VALVAFGCFIALGHYVITTGEPAFFAPLERATFDHSTLVAWWLTWSCYPQALLPLCIILLILAWRFPTWRTRLLLSIVALIVSWRAADFFQHLFERARPAMWVVKHELSFSYPSSHAAIAAGFYLLWAVMLYASDLPKSVRTTAATVLVLLALAICWSRLALGAHYATDLIGGGLLGISVASIVLGILCAGPVGGVGGRVSEAAE